jgi:hypothetical protein
MPRIGPSGAHVWFQVPNIFIFWLELGPVKSQRFIQGGAALTALALTIPQPYGAIVGAIAAAQLADVRKKTGDKGVWVKFGPPGYMQSRTRTQQNKEKNPF